MGLFCACFYPKGARHNDKLHAPKGALARVACDCVEFVVMFTNTHRCPAQRSPRNEVFGEPARVRFSASACRFSKCAVKALEVHRPWTMD
jgi:hypothetical protein